jgi:hypothetical protein
MNRLKNLFNAHNNKAQGLAIYTVGTVVLLVGTVGLLASNGNNNTNITQQIPAPIESAPAPKLIT